MQFSLLINPTSMVMISVVLLELPPAGSELLLISKTILHVYNILFIRNNPITVFFFPQGGEQFPTYA